MQDFISNVWYQLAFAILLLVAGWRMNATGANWLLLAAWVIIGSCVFRSPWLSEYDPIPRVLITMGVIAPICLVIYYLLWTATTIPTHGTGSSGGASPTASALQSMATTSAQTHAEPPRFLEKFDKVFISVGGNILELHNINGSRLPLFGLSPTGDLRLYGLGFTNPTAGGTTSAMAGGTTPAIASINDGRLFIDAEVFAGPGRPAMHIRNNELSDRPAKWDTNTDNKYALEIVNEACLPVLQVIYADEARAAIKGVFVNGEAVAIVDQGIGTFRKEDVSNHPIKRIFKYPSWKYRGVFDE